MEARRSKLCRMGNAALCACEAVHAGRIIRWVRQGRRCSSAHHAAEAFDDKVDIDDITSPRRSRPAVALEKVKDLFAFQTVGCLHVSDGLERVTSSSKHLAEGTRRD